MQVDFNKTKELLGHDDFLEFHVLEVMEKSTKEERNKQGAGLYLSKMAEEEVRQ